MRWYHSAYVGSRVGQRPTFQSLGSPVSYMGTPRGRRGCCGEGHWAWHTVGSVGHQYLYQVLPLTTLSLRWLSQPTH